MYINLSKEMMEYHEEITQQLKMDETHIGFNYNSLIILYLQEVLGMLDIHDEAIELI